MIEAGLWGAIGASSLLIGAGVAFTGLVGGRGRGLILAFGAGILFGSVAYELVEEAVAASVTGVEVAVGFGLGAVTFFLGSVAIDRLFGVSDGGRRTKGARAAGLAIVLGTVLDGIPESIVLGLSLAPGEGVAPAILIAIFLSNVPEGLSATEDLVEGGMARLRVLGLWVLVVLSSAVAAALGFGLLGSAPIELILGAQAFAAGAILAMLAESAIPEAYQDGGRAVGLATALGFALAAFLSLKP